MHTKLKAIGLILLLAVLAPLALPAEDDEFMTIKLHGGYNFWLVEAISANTGSSTANFSMGGFSFGAGILFLNPKHIQIGVEAAYLPMLLGTSGGSNLALGMVPLTGDIVINLRSFYFDIGAGAAFMVANLGSNAKPITGLTFAAPLPGFVVKLGLGFNFRLVEFLSLDFGGDLYLPLTDFGASDVNYPQINSPLIWAIGFGQLNIHAGLDFNI